MRLEEPRWWHAASGTGDLAARVLAPLGGIYGSIVEARYRRHKGYRARLPVICIGNFTAGGTGKTPLALFVVEHLKRIGAAPACLTRGYGGNRAGPVWVAPHADTAREIGDEALLLARSAGTVVARDRKAGAEAIERRGEATAIVMDDGLQNPALAKDLAIAVVDGVRGLGNGAVMPAGPLRAPLDFQLGLVDCIVVNGRSGENGAGGATVLERLRRTFPGPVLAARPEPAEDAGWLTERPVVAFAGIAHPERFFDLLRNLGADVVHTARFADHYVFREADAADLLRRAEAAGARLVTTAKDLARLSGAEGRCKELLARARALPIRLAFDERDRTRLEALIGLALRKGEKAAEVPSASLPGVRPRDSA